MATREGDTTAPGRVLGLTAAQDRTAALDDEPNERFRALIESSRGLVWRCDSEGRYTFLSHGWEQTFGYPREEMLGRRFADFQRPEVRARDLEEFGRNLAGGFVSGYETSQLSKDGREVHLRLYTAPVYGVDGQLNGLQGTAEDITERKRSEDALRQSEARYALTLGALDDGLWDWHIPSGKAFFSAVYYTLLGYDDGEFPANYDSWRLLVHPEDLDRVERGLRLGFESGGKFDIELRMKMKSGAWLWVATRGKTVERESDARALRMVGTLTDITERKQRESELAELVRRLQLATTSARMGVWDWDVVNNVLTWDDRMFELYGLRREDFSACLDAWQSGLHPEDRDRAVAESQAAIDGTADYDTTFRVLHPDRTIRFVKADGMVIRDERGVAVRMLGLNWDVTGPRQAAEERANLEAQLHQAQKMESVGRLAGGVAHDFNNMLGAILANVEFALEQVGPNARLREDLEEVRAAAHRSADLTRQLLTFARKQTVARKVLNLNDSLAGILMMLRRIIGEDVALTSRQGEGLWLVTVDPSQIDQILTNLCVNARDAISGVGKLTVETDNVSFDADYCAAHAESVPGDYVRLAISDDGHGMDKETQSHLFEPFFTTKVMGKGTGLGLATVYGIVKQNHGTIEVYSEVGHGTTFKIYLPRHQATPLPERADQAALSTARGHETILLVEDEASILKASKRMLEQMGYVVLPAGTAGEAIRLAQEHAGALHLLMTDVVMPEMNGRDLAKKLLSLYPGLKRVCMSGYTADVIAHHGVLGEGVHFLQKPFSRQDLAVIVRRALDGEPDN